MKNMILINRMLIFITGAFVLSCGANSDLGVKVSGKVEDKVEGSIVTLNQYGTNGFEPVDTIYIDDDGTFTFFVDAKSAEFYRLNFYDRQQVNLILDGTEDHVKITANGTSPNAKATVSGSKQTSYLAEVDTMMKAQQARVQEMNQQAIKARVDGDEATLNMITDEYYASLGESRESIKSYIRTIAPSLAGFYALNALKPEENLDFYQEVVGIYEKELPNHPFTKDIKTQVESLRQVAVGAMAPEISLPSPNGDIVTLSSLRGKYVLVDFWAAWCRPCRAENPNVLRMYNIYKNQDFEILGVSLDRNREAWLKAIQDDGLIWKHASDLKYFNSEAAAAYQIQAIPATFLIGPDGKIIAKGLRGPSLEAKLQEIFS